MKKMKKVIYALFISIFLISCGGIKTPTGQENIELPCLGKEFRSNKKYFRAFATSLSNNVSGAMQDAEDQAAATLALQIEKKIKVVSDRYSKSLTEGQKGEYIGVSERGGRQTAKQVLRNTKIICAKTTRDRKTGMYNYYTVIEVPVDGVMKSFANSISQESKSQINLDREKFRKIFDEETGSY
tara:strand:- start:4481 stop:5032 length:552 start_codon:yes stop_codon:yes gene_type:complete